MAVSGIVVTLASDPGLAEQAMAALSADPRLTLGERFGLRLAAVAETDSPRADRDLWDQLHAIPGVVHVDVTFVALDQPAPELAREMENTDAHA
ncbi:MAG: hypothetical protein JNL50_08045 [Phycisphaerae bacterium]|nr:hypothetical protein [Phycisphaerae bacterium]